MKSSNYAREQPAIWLISSVFACMVVFTMTFPIHDLLIVLWWTWPMVNYVCLVLALYLLVQIARVAYWQWKGPRVFHQDWWNQDGSLHKCSSPKHHEEFNMTGEAEPVPRQSNAERAAAILAIVKKQLWGKGQ